jgi:hypothetical protein
MATVRSKRALVIGRTVDDLRKCESMNFSNHAPALTTLLFVDYANFDGDLITAQTIKYGAVAAGSIELSKRTLESALEYPGQVYIGTSQHAHDYQTPEPYKSAVSFLYTDKYDYPTANSGLFTLWLAVHLGYTEIYTIGLDLISTTFPNNKYNHLMASDFIHDFEAGRDTSKYPVETHLKDHLSFDIAEKIINDNPHVSFYRTGKFSQLPCEVKKPPIRRK